jgi:hypothetical protein
MAQARAAAARPLIDSDQVEGTPVLSQEGGQVGTIRRVIFDKVSGRIVYVVMTFAESFGLGDVTYVLPWSRLSYNKDEGGYRTDITQADLQSALPVGQDNTDLADGEAGEAFFRIPPGWRAV